MDKEEKYSYWLDTAEYDMTTADSTFITGRYFYMFFYVPTSFRKTSKRALRLLCR